MTRKDKTNTLRPALASWKKRPIGTVTKGDVANVRQGFPALAMWCEGGPGLGVFCHGAIMVPNMLRFNDVLRYLVIP